ncbi:MAG TPA: anthranilate synthase component I [Nitrospirae bacterium]|nr:anthranilate synthase component I [Nitrospirota bacterium]
MNHSLDEFINLSKEGNLIPLYEEIIGDLTTPVSAFICLKKKPSFLLESVVGGEKWARYSFIGLNPLITVSYKNERTIIKNIEDKTEKVLDINPLTIVKEILSIFKPVGYKDLPRFYGGFVGYIGYDIVRFFEKLPKRNNKSHIPMPDLFMLMPKNILIFDNLRQTIKVVNNVYVKGKNLKSLYNKAKREIDSIIRQLKRGSLEGVINEKITKDEIIGEVKSNFTKEDFIDAVNRAKEYIYAGDIVQVVLSQRFHKETNHRAFDIYRALRLINPSPYMYFLDIGDESIVGSSPEILVRCEDGEITVRPIAGTRKRGKTEKEDLMLEKDLLQDPKERAEHIMLVDLGRNDVGKVAEISTVRVTDLMTIERYSHVMHIVSNVKGRIKKGLDAFDVFSATFPAGTVSGAPKVRAMEIIEELEPTKRGIYAGAIGYFGYSGNMDTCITIRTLIIKGKDVYIQAGAGIVADSDPQSEYVETINKAKAMLKATEFFRER